MSAVDEVKIAIERLEVWGQAPRRRILRLLKFVENENNDLREALSAATADVFVIGTIKMLAQIGETEKIVELCNEWLEKFESRPTMREADAPPAGFEDEYFDSLLDSDIDGK